MKFDIERIDTATGIVLCTFVSRDFPNKKACTVEVTNINAKMAKTKEKTHYKVKSEYKPKRERTTK